MLVLGFVPWVLCNIGQTPYHASLPILSLCAQSSCAPLNFSTEKAISGLPVAYRHSCCCLSLAPSSAGFLGLQFGVSLIV